MVPEKPYCLKNPSLFLLVNKWCVVTYIGALQKIYQQTANSLLDHMVFFLIIFQS